MKHYKRMLNRIEKRRSKKFQKVLLRAPDAATADKIRDAFLRFAANGPASAPDGDK